MLATLFPPDQTAAARRYGLAILTYPSRPTASPTVETAQDEAITQWFNGTEPSGKAAATIAAPTLVADGADDALDPVSNDHQLANLIPKAQLVLYPDAGHAFLFQDESSFVPRIQAFLP